MPYTVLMASELVNISRARRPRLSLVVPVSRGPDIVLPLVASIPVGYSDGLRRVFSNRGHVLIRGHRLPIVGRVTMNTVMVDATDYPDVRGGDEVVRFGRQGTEVITQAELEQQADTIIADLRTMWGNSNPKVLVDR